MWSLILILYIQAGLNVDIVSTKLNGIYGTQEACHQQEIVQTTVLPTDQGEDAKWQYAVCVRTVLKGSE